jgi:hypothetical protein
MEMMTNGFLFGFGMTFGVIGAMASLIVILALIGFLNVEN